jgi:hypothetical protein
VDTIVIALFFSLLIFSLLFSLFSPMGVFDLLSTMAKWDGVDGDLGGVAWVFDFNGSYVMVMGFG